MFRFRVLKFRVQGLGFQGLRFRILRFWVLRFGFRVLGFRVYPQGPGIYTKRFSMRLLWGLGIHDVDTI